MSLKPCSSTLHNTTGRECLSLLGTQTTTTVSVETDITVSSTSIVYINFMTTALQHMHHINTPNYYKRNIYIT